MLSLYILSKYSIRPSNGVLYQSFNFTMRLCSSSSDSSSSDSDSDNEKAKPRRKYDKSSAMLDNENLQNLDNITKKTAFAKIVTDTASTSLKEVEQKNAKVTPNLTAYLNNIVMARKAKKTIDVALQPKKKNESKRATHLSHEKKLISAAEDVANTIGGDKAKTTSDLLQKVLASRMEVLKEQQLQNIKLRRNKKLRQPPESERQEEDLGKKSIIRTLLDEYNKQSSIKKKQPVENKQPPDENSITRRLLKNINQSREGNVQVENKQPPVKDKQPPDENSITRQLLKTINQSRESNVQRLHARTDIKIWNGKSTPVFDQIVIPKSDIPELKTWAALEQRELKALTIHPPANVFQEMILWTEQGKLWKFPIDNEQGMEEEHNVHFVEHVFIERHLKGWCPTSGPVRHFMELVCTGLSKNPYLTVQEKVDHIMWYKDYFASKQDLLKELGAIKDPLTDKVKEITE